MELTEAPIIKISKAELSGLSATVNFKAQHKDQQKYFLMVSTCADAVFNKYANSVLVLIPHQTLSACLL